MTEAQYQAVLRSVAVRAHLILRALDGDMGGNTLKCIALARHDAEWIDEEVARALNGK